MPKVMERTTLGLSSLRMMYCFCDWPGGAPLATGTVAVLRLDADCAAARAAAEEEGEEAALVEEGGARLGVDASEGFDGFVR